MRTEEGSTLKGDVIGGITTFLTMSYIVVVNPAILAQAGIPFSGALTATVLLCVLMTAVMGQYAKLPYGVAPGMGLNAFFTFGICMRMNVPWQMALGLVFWAGVLFLLISFTPLREKIARAIPQPLRAASAIGIGLFLTLIGFKNMGLIVPDSMTLVRLGDLDPKILISLMGLFLMFIFLLRKSPFTFLIGITAVTIVFWQMGWTHIPESIWSTPDFDSALFHLNISGILDITLIPAIMTIFLTDLFDSISTFVGVSNSTGLVDKNGEPKNLRQGLIVDAWATLCAGLFGTSSGTAYIESTSGIEMGGRSGRAALVTALCFIPCFFIAPLAGAIPAQATAPVLILVGALMFRNFSGLDTKRLQDMIPAFLTIVLIPFTFSITQGIIWGFISYTFIRVFRGKFKEISPMLYGITAVCIVLLYFLSQRPH